MATWQLSLMANVAVSAFYFAIFAIVVTALYRARELTRNPLGVATAAIFFSCGVGHAIHAEHLLAPSLGFGLEEARAAVDWHVAWWDVATAAVGAVYLSLRRSYGVLLRGPEMSPDLDRAQRERTIVAAEELFRNTFEDAPVGMALVRLDGRFERVNRALADIVGMTQDEMQAVTFQAITHPDDLDEDVALLGRLIAGEIPSYKMEKRYLRAGGEPVWVMLSASLVRDDDGRPRRAIAQVEDISARKAEQAELERSREQLAEAQTVARLGSFDEDLRTGARSYSDALYDVYGLSPDSEQPLPDRLLALVHPDDREAVLAARQKAHGEHHFANGITYRIVRPDGELRFIDVRGRVIRDDDGMPLRAIGTAQDVTETARLQQEASASRDELATVLEAATETGIIGCRPDGTIMTFNSGAERMLGYRAQELVGRRTPAVFHDPAEVARRAGELGIEPGFEVFVSEARRGHAEEREWTYVRKDGARVPVSLTVTAQRRGDGALAGFLGIARDLTQVKRADRARHEAEELFRTMFEHAPIGICLIGVGDGYAGCVLRANDAMVDLTGIDLDELLGTRLTALAHPEDQAATADALARLGAGASRIHIEQRFRHPDGHFVWALLSASTVPAPDGRPLFAVAQVVDISERKRFEGQLRHLADHDPLTGLFNRRRFEEELERRIAEVGRYDRRAAVLLIDLDRFKLINDSLGHSAGDELITRIGGVFRNSVRESDIVARIGGDEFAAILPETSEEEAIAVTKKLLAAVQHHGTMTSGNRHASVTASIGIALLDRESVQLTPDDVVVEADIAMYDAKEAGRNTFSVFHSMDSRRERVHVRAEWLDRMRSGLENDRFTLYAQPIFAIGASTAEWHELLLRYRDDSSDIIGPGAFLYLAERFDLIKEIDRWVLAQAVGLLHDHHAAGNDVALSVNISAKTLTDHALPDYLGELFKGRTIPEGKLMIEVTETAAIVNVDRARAFAETVHEHGCLLALDDFGSGFASFYYLKHLAFDYLKIDGEFVQHLPDNRTDQLVVRSVVDVARGLGTKVIAEFVDRPETLELLEELGVDYAQGFHLGKPRPVEEALSLPRDRHLNFNRVAVRSGDSARRI